jgi:membrane-associated protein
MDAWAVVGLVGLLFVKELGVPVPVPGDLLVIGAGIAAAASGPGAGLVLVAILLAGFAGGTLQFLLVKGALRRPLVAVLARFGVSRDRLDRLADWLRRRGVRGVAIARLTPGLRIGAISASGIAALPLPVFVPGLVVGNTLFVVGHFLLGYAVGAPALEIIRSAGGVGAAAVAFLVLAAIGALGWRAIRRRRSGSAVEPNAGGSWAEAACPACLALTFATDVPA